MDTDVQWEFTEDADYPDSVEALQKVYTKWASTYDRDMVKRGDFGNKVFAEASMEFIENNDFAQMLDVGAGTGLTGMLLRKAGFKGHVDGVDMSEAMLKMAEQKGVYRKTFVHMLTEHDPLPVPNGTYDVVVSFASFMVNHMSVQCILPILDVLKSGGLFICNSRISKNNDKYLNDLLKFAEDLAEEGRIRLIRKAEVPYSEHVNMCYLLVYQKI